MRRHSQVNFSFLPGSIFAGKNIGEILLEQVPVLRFRFVVSHHAPGTTVNVDDKDTLMLPIIEIFGSSACYAPLSIDHVFHDRIAAWRVR